MGAGDGREVGLVVVLAGFDLFDLSVSDAVSRSEARVQ